MSRNLIILLGLAILFLSVGGVFLFSNFQKFPIINENKMMKTDSINKSGVSGSGEKILEDEESPNTKYVTYEKTVLETLKENRRVLFFYANWCPTCRPVNEEIQSNLDKIPDDVRIIRINYNDTETDQEEKDLAKKYGVTYQHTFVQIDKSGNEINKWNGGSLDDILSKIE